MKPQTVTDYINHADPAVKKKLQAMRTCLKKVTLKGIETLK